jgi:hypothetical protein
MPVNVRSNMGKIEVKLTNNTGTVQDERTRGARYEYIGRGEAIVLIKQLAGAIESMEN